MLVEKIPGIRTRTDFARLLNGSAELAVIFTYAIVIFIYVVVAKISLMLASIHPSATPIWPTAGFALACVLLLGYRIVPAIFVGSFIVNITTAGSLYTSVGIAAGNTLEGLVTAFVLNEWARSRNAFERPWDVGKVIASCFAPGAMISATIGVTCLSLGGYAETANFRTLWTTWWIGDSSGMLVIAPALVLWGKEWRRFFEPGEMVPSLCLYGATSLIGLLAFSPLLEQTPSRTAMAFLAALPLTWAAVRRNPRDTATTALLLSAFAVWGTMMNDGPFVRSNLNESFLLLLAFMITATGPSLALSAEVVERKRQQEHVQFVLLELSHRSKNLLQVVLSTANQVAQHSDSYKAFYAGFSRRLRAFAEIHDLLVKGDWRGADIRELARAQVVPFTDRGTSIIIEGPNLISIQRRQSRLVSHCMNLEPTPSSTVRFQLVLEGCGLGGNSVPAKLEQRV
jgi:integral membrane sensor domain MASE1